MKQVNVDNIKQLFIIDDNALDIKVEDDKMYLYFNINPNIIDNNFNEIEKRISDLESIINLRILGNLNNLNNKLNK